MIKKIFIITGVLLLVGAILTACGGQTAPTTAPATQAPATTAVTEAPTTAPELTGDTIRGGKLYDIWFEELGVDVPKDVNPLWATSSTAGEPEAPEDSYRCAVCHGFNFKGDLGFVGVANSTGKDPNEILAVLKGSTDPKHDFSGYMDDQALTDLALFVSKEQMDVTAVVADNKPVNGNPDNGKKLFENTCIDCHGPQGLAINFQNDAGPEYPATIANEAPVEFLTKLRFGQPGIAKMPSGIDNSWTNQDYADVIAYVQTLPDASLVAEGGRLYSSWIEDLGATAPETDQPLWNNLKGTSSLSGGDTWLCSTCHGMDYNGKDGVNTEGTGFPGILAAKDMSEADLTAWLDGTKNKDHNFKSYLTADEMSRLVAFMKSGIVDHSAFVNADNTAKGDATHGKTLFNSVCQICHGADGKSINFKADEGGTEYVGNVATEEPFGFFHVGSVGFPGAHMPAGMNLGWTEQDIADLLAYAQTLPTK